MHRSPLPGLALSLLSLLACGGSADADGSGGSAGSYGGSAQGNAGTQGDTSVGGPCEDASLCAPDFRTPAGEGVPPPSPSNAPPAEGSESALIVSGIFLGSATSDGSTDPAGWKQSGFDLDGWSSTPEQGFHCKTRSGGKTKVIRMDGAHGIDNSFGQNVVGDTLVSVYPKPLADTNEAIAAGGPTMMIHVDALGAGSDYAALTGGVSIVQSAGAPADWATSSWRPWSSPASVAFSQAYLTSSTLVAWLAGPVVVPLRVSGKLLRVTVHSARLMVDVSDRAHGVKGMIGGIVDPDEFLSAVASTDDLQPDCDSPMYVSIRNNLRAQADILMDGTQDPGKECEGISIGLSFETRTALAGASMEPPALHAPCSE